MIRYTLGLTLAILVTVGCTNLKQGGDAAGSKSSSTDSVVYAHLIMSTLVNSSNYLAPDFAQEYELVYADNSYYSYKTNKVLYQPVKKDTANGFTGTKEIKDKELGLQLRVHRWGCGCEMSLPNTIIYVSNNKDFEHAFLLADELRTRTNDTAAEKHRPAGPPSLQFQLNFMANALHINTLQMNRQISRFLFLITDSLLGLQKLTPQDVPQLQKEKEIYHSRYGDTSVCARCIDAEMSQMIADLKANTGTEIYYRSSTHHYPGYWKFEIVINSGKLYINAVFGKAICGKLHA